MDRRAALKGLGLLSSTALFLPSCQLFEEKRVPIALNNLKVTIEQEDLLSRLVAAILPADQEFKGAADLNIQNFIWVMVDDCRKEADQKQFMSGLTHFLRYAEQQLETDFEELPAAKQAEFLLETLAAEPVPAQQPVSQDDGELPPPEAFLPDIQYMLRSVKGLTIQGYLGSQYIMTEVMPYALVPGGYNLCETIDPNKRINING